MYRRERDVIADIKWQLGDREPRLIKIRFTCSRKFIFSRELSVATALSMSEVKSFIRSTKEMLILVEFSSTDCVTFSLSSVKIGRRVQERSNKFRRNFMCLNGDGFQKSKCYEGAC